MKPGRRLAPTANIDARELQILAVKHSYNNINFRLKICLELASDMPDLPHKIMATMIIVVKRENDNFPTVRIMLFLQIMKA
jgi:hypothetical protein